MQEMWTTNTGSCAVAMSIASWWRHLSHNQTLGSSVRIISVFDCRVFYCLKQTYIQFIHSNWHEQHGGLILATTATFVLVMAELMMHLCTGGKHSILHCVTDLCPHCVSYRLQICVSLCQLMQSMFVVLFVLSNAVCHTVFLSSLWVALSYFFSIFCIIVVLLSSCVHNLQRTGEGREDEK